MKSLFGLFFEEMPDLSKIPKVLVLTPVGMNCPNNFLVFLGGRYARATRSLRPQSSDVVQSTKMEEQGWVETLQRKKKE